MPLLDVILVRLAEMLDHVPISQEIEAAQLGEPRPPGGSVRTRAGPRNRKTGSDRHEQGEQMHLADAEASAADWRAVAGAKDACQA
jgi:hypothetical protein